MKSYQIHLIRHGITDGNLAGQYIGSTDLPLCSAGEEQLRTLAEKYEYPAAEAYFVSPMKRCIETLDIIYPEANGIAIDGLRECDFGAFEGMTAAELQQSRLFAATAVLVKHFSNAMPLEERNLQRSDMTRLEPILEYTQLHHGEDLTLDGASNAMGLNKEYFCRLFKKNMGVSYLQYLYQVRTTAVCRELEISDDPIGEIAERHGFRDPKMLSQHFREIYGCTPSEKRKFFREVSLENREEQ